MSKRKARARRFVGRWPLFVGATATTASAGMVAWALATGKWSLAAAFAFFVGVSLWPNLELVPCPGGPADSDSKEPEVWVHLVVPAFLCGGVGVFTGVGALPAVLAMVGFMAAWDVAYGLFAKPTTEAGKQAWLPRAAALRTLVGVCVLGGWVVCVIELAAHLFAGDFGGD